MPFGFLPIVQSTSASTYTLVADVGAVALAGQPAGSLSSHVLAADLATMALGGAGGGTSLLGGFVLALGGAGGMTAELLWAHSMSATVGPFTTDGPAIAISAPARLFADDTNLALIGPDVGLITARLPLVADTSSAAVAGVSVGLRADRMLPATSVGLTTAAPAATMTYTPANAYTMAATVGAFTEAGIAVGLAFGRSLAATVSSFAVAGQLVGLSNARTLPATVGTFNVGSPDVALSRTTAGAYVLRVDLADFVVGAPATALNQYRLSPDVGAFAVSLDAIVSHGFLMPVGVADINLYGQPVTMPIGLPFALTSGSAAVSGGAVELFVGRRIITAAGDFNLTGSVQLILAAGRVMNAGVGSFGLSGIAVAITAPPQRLVIDGGDVRIAAEPVQLQVGHVMVADAGVYDAAGQPAGHATGLVIAADPGVFAIEGVAAGGRIGRNLVAAVRAFAVSGKPAVLSAQLFGRYTLAADCRDLVATGRNAILAAGLRMDPDLGEIDAAGQDVVLTVRRAYRLVATTAVTDLGRPPAQLLKGYRLGAGTRALAVDGSAGMARGIRIELAVGDFALAWSATEMRTGGRILAASPRAMTVAGLVATLAVRVDHRMLADPGALILDGTALELVQAYLMQAERAAFSHGSRAVGMARRHRPRPTSISPPPSESRPPNLAAA